MTGVQPLAHLQPPPPSLPHSAHPALPPPAERTACASPRPVCFQLHPFALQAALPAEPSTAPLPAPALQLSYLDLRATGFWKLSGHSPCPLAKHLSAPTATWTSLFSFPNPLHYNNLLTYLSITLLWAKDNGFPPPKSSALIQALNLNSSDAHL